MEPISKNRMDVAHILMVTSKMGVIDECLNISVVRARNRLWVVEEERGMRLKQWRVAKEEGRIDRG